MKYDLLGVVMISLCWYGNSTFKLTEELFLVCVIPNP